MPGKPVLKIIMFPKQLPEISPWSKLVFTPLKGTKFSDNPKFSPYTAPCTCKRSNDEHDDQYQYGIHTCMYIFIHSFQMLYQILLFILWNYKSKNL